jgi:hypothetical protein
VVALLSDNTTQVLQPEVKADLAAAVTAAVQLMELVVLMVLAAAVAAVEVLEARTKENVVVMAEMVL